MISEENFSYWDRKKIGLRSDVLIVGAGITGLSCAHRIAQLRPETSIRIVDSMSITRAASTRNAGFVCFGSLTEVLDDIEKFGQEVALDLVRRRYKGMELIKKTFSPGAIEYMHTGGFELLNQKDWTSERLKNEMAGVNSLLEPIIGKDVFEVVGNQTGDFPFPDNYFVLKNRFEGQLNPARYVSELTARLTGHRAEILSPVSVKEINPTGEHIEIETDAGRMRTSQLVLATNGLTSSLDLDAEEITPTRNTVLVSENIGLPFKGVFHAEKGFIYFRNVGKRLLIGGGRHWDLENENVGNMEVNHLILDRLKSYAKEVILPGKPMPQFPYQWSGIMGVTKNKKPIVKQISERQYLAAGYSGMGVALGMHSGFEIAEMVCKDLYH